MPRVYFTISSISLPTFDTVTAGYHKQVDEKKSSIRLRAAFLFTCVKSLCRERKLPQKVIPTKTPRSISPIIDPQFLLFAILVAEYMRQGYQVGHMGGSGAFVHYAECSLATFVTSTIQLGERHTLSITPHKHSVEVSDIPEYARLLKLKSLTRDASLSALLNRLALWLYLFVQVYHYGWKIVLYHPKTNDKKELSNIFFSKFSPDMPL